MKLSHAIALSLLCHVGVLGYMHLRGGTTVEERELPVWFELQQAEFAETSPTPEYEVRIEQKAPAKAGGGGGEEAEPKSEPKSEPKPKSASKSEPKPEPEPEPEPEPRETAEAKPEPKPEPETKPEPKPEPTEEPEPVVAQKESQEADAPEVEKTSETSSETDAAEETSGEAVASASETSGTGGEGSASGSASPNGGAQGDGSGEGVGSGDGPGGGAVDRGRLIRGYATSIYKVLARNQRYPRLARRAGLEGIVKVTVTIDEAGNILDVQLAESSGHKSLDQAALETVRRLEKLPNPPKALAWKKKQLNIPIKYDLDRRG